MSADPVEVVGRPVVVDRQLELLRHAQRVSPGGVHSSVRMLEKPVPLFISSAKGSRVWDANGNELIDYVMGQGPMLLGHSPAPVVDRVASQIEDGIIFAAQHRLELEVADRLIGLIPGAEQVRFGTTGTEAILAAIRIARAVTGRERLIKFRGHYHGWNDPLLFNVSSDSAWDSQSISFKPVAESGGLQTSEPPIVLEWNEPDQLAGVLARYGDQVAAVVMEPVMANVFVIPPQPQYLEEVRRLCDAHGVLLIFDEVITGFRLAVGGAQEWFNVRADLAVFGKALASGFPVSCVVGRRELFKGVDTGEVMLAGTFNSNPVGLAAASAVLDYLTLDLYSGLELIGSELVAGLRDAGDSTNAGMLVQGYPQLFGIAATFASSAKSFADTLDFDRSRLTGLLSRLIGEGVRPSGRGTFFLSAAHTLDDARTTSAVMAAALEERPAGA